MLFVHCFERTSDSIIALTVLQFYMTMPVQRVVTLHHYCHRNRGCSFLALGELERQRSESEVKCVIILRACC